MRKPIRNPASRLSWLLALLPLLLAAALAIPLLDVDAFNGDEPASLIAAGVLRSGPLSLDEIWKSIINVEPHQAYGWPLLLAIWGYLVGWSEVAVRALSLFFGMLLSPGSIARAVICLRPGQVSSLRCCSAPQCSFSPI